MQLKWGPELTFCPCTGPFWALAIQIKWTYSHTRLHIWKRDCLIIVFVDVGIKKIKDLFVSAKYCWEGISTKWSTERRGRRPLWVLRAEFMPSLRLTRTWVAVWRLGVCASRSAPSRHRETQGCPHVLPSVAGGRHLEGVAAASDTDRWNGHRNMWDTPRSQNLTQALNWNITRQNRLASRWSSKSWSFLKILRHLIAMPERRGQLPVSCGLEPPNNLRPEEARCQSVKPLLCQLAAHQGGGGG